jgi:hypothetical protein
MTAHAAFSNAILDFGTGQNDFGRSWYRFWKKRSGTDMVSCGLGFWNTEDDIKGISKNFWKRIRQEQTCVHHLESFGNFEI